MGGAGHLSAHRGPLSERRVRSCLPPEVVSVLPGRAESSSDCCAKEATAALTAQISVLNLWQISSLSNREISRYSYALSRFRMACTSVSSPLSGSDLGAG